MSIIDVELAFKLSIALGSAMNAYSGFIILGILAWPVLFVIVPMICLTIFVQVIQRTLCILAICICAGIRSAWHIRDIPLTHYMLFGYDNSTTAMLILRWHKYETILMFIQDISIRLILSLNTSG